MFGAALKLALLGAAPVPEVPPSAYVEGLFDDYAERFETALVEKLNYSVPAKLFSLVEPHGPFRLTVDLGCGTGLFGVEVVAQRHGSKAMISPPTCWLRPRRRASIIICPGDLSLAAEQCGLFSEEHPATVRISSRQPMC